MKLIGRRSVASVMRWVLGLTNVFVFVGVVFIGLGLLISIFVPESAAVWMDRVAQADGDLATNGMLVPLRISFFASFVAILSTWWVINRLRRIFLALNQGDAFERANVKRLRAIGLGLIGVQVSAAILAFSGPLGRGAAESDFDLNLGAWLGILIVFMLAEVFRQGATMRDEQQMTV